MGAHGLVIRTAVGAADLRGFARRGGPLRRFAGARDRAGVGRSEPGGGGPPCGAGAPVAARRGGALQRRGSGRAAQPPSAGAAGEAESGAPRRMAGVSACRTRPGGGGDQQLPPARHRGPHRTTLVRVVWAVVGVPSAAPHGLVVADDAARPPQGRRRGAGAIKNLAATLEAIAAAHPGKTLQLWCEDEARKG